MTLSVATVVMPRGEISSAVRVFAPSSQRFPDGVSDAQGPPVVVLVNALSPCPSETKIPGGGASQKTDTAREVVSTCPPETTAIS